ncbi:MAG: GspH/FimT family pseudopilin [Candidatus Competibacteraceae bacterium]|nr:GspH/FimT family pseudopilin [Candidatus Competibacteraceae bacterium]
MNRKLGFTLIELIITVALVAIIVTLGVPTFQGMIRNNRIIVHTNDFISSLNLARSEANKRGRRVALCKSDKTDNIITCTTANNCCTTSTGDWENGWVVFVDANNNASVDAGDTVLRVHGSWDNGDTLQGNGPMATYISYSPDGFTRLAGSAAFGAGTMTFGLCDGNNKKNTIVISSTGRAHVEKVACP